MNRRRLASVILLTVGGLTVACSAPAPKGSTGQPPSSEAGARPTLTATSPAFAPGASIPTEYAMPAAGGRNVSVPLQWADAPAGTKSFAIEVVDLNPVARSWVHWLVIDVPPDVGVLPAGASGSGMPSGARELKNSFGVTGWGGPQPPRGTGRHDYRFTVIALDTPRLDLSPDTSLARFREAAGPHVLSQASFVGTFQR